MFIIRAVLKTVVPLKPIRFSANAPGADKRSTCTYDCIRQTSIIIYPAAYKLPKQRGRRHQILVQCFKRIYRIYKLVNLTVKRAAFIHILKKLQRTIFEQARLRSCALNLYRHQPCPYEHTDILSRLL